ncbi:MAG: 30S ribosomal protein S6 [bacterium]
MIYELLYIIPNKYSEIEAKEIHLKIIELAKKQGLEIINEENLGTKKLAYPIKQSYFGYYLLVHFKFEDADNLLSFNQKLIIMPEVLRSQIIKYKELPKKTDILKFNQAEASIETVESILKEETNEEEKEIKPIITAETKPIIEELKIEEKSKDERKKINLNDLDKKIDELLENVDG